MHAEEYRKMADVEDVMWYYRALHRNVATALRGVAPAGAAILDAGCGTGGLLRALRREERGWRLAGVDLSPLACELTRERTGALVLEGSVEQMPFGADSYEAIVSCDVLCQVVEPARALGEFRRVLKPGGVLVLTLPAFPWMYSYHDRQVGNLRRYTRGGLADLLRAAGWRPLAMTYWNMLPFPLAVLRRKVFPAREGESDVHLFSPSVEGGFDAMMRLEHRWIARGHALPFGSSLLAVARAEPG
ncbi:MAG: class I SAM-dependent methyltransferase [Candidatus Didemnitutus sp.]|nr:class I SAM-dependent methyltransferase [Candidatus Didemnitutus sp.]